MTDLATPNLPSRDFDSTAAFYAPLGFAVGYRAEGWMILDRGTLKLEFFPFPDLDPLTSSFGSCLRVDDLDGLVAEVEAAGVPVKSAGQPRLVPARVEPSGLRIAFLIDPDGSLLRLIQN